MEDENPRVKPVSAISIEPQNKGPCIDEPEKEDPHRLRGDLIGGALVEELHLGTEASSTGALVSEPERKNASAPTRHF